MWMKLFERARTKFFSPSGSTKERSSLTKWFCSTPTGRVREASLQVQRSSSWRSLKERRPSSLKTRTVSVDELHRKKKQQSPVICLHSRRAKTTGSHTRFDRLSSSLVNYNDVSKRLDSSRGGGDSGYSEDNVPVRAPAWHRSCPHCHCERPAGRQDSSTSFESRQDQLLSSRSFPHIRPLPTPRRVQRRRNLSCDSSLWNRKGPTSSRDPPPVFGELNLAAIELDSLRRSSLSSSLSSSSPSDSSSRLKGVRLVCDDYSNPSSVSSNFSVKRGDHVRLLKALGTSTLLVQKDDDGSIGFLPRHCLTHSSHPINSFLSLKGLRETVL